MTSASDTMISLEQYYNDPNLKVPPDERVKWNWTSENNYGFLRGIVAYGRKSDTTQLHDLLVSGQFAAHEDRFIDSMFDVYISPFHRCYNEYPGSCHCWSTISDSAASGEENAPAYRVFKRAVFERDRRCLFCWRRRGICVAAPIIPQDHVYPWLLQQAGLTQKHQVQNSLLLCLNCAAEFGRLKRYVECVNEQLVVKLAYNDPEEWANEKYQLSALRTLARNIWKLTNRRTVEDNGEFVLKFEDDSQGGIPSRKALELHRTACLIWQMAGGVEDDDEYCSGDTVDCPVNTAALRRRFNIRNLE